MHSLFCALYPTAKAGDPMKIDKVVITPDPPKKGQSISVQLYFTLSEASEWCMCRKHILK